MRTRIMFAMLVLSSTMVACGDGNDLSCEERADHARSVIASALEENLACTVDADCTTVGIGTGCGGGCPTAVARKGEVAVEAAMRMADQDYCDGYQADGCEVVSPACIALQAACQGGMCTTLAR